MADSPESYQKLKIPELKKLLQDRSLAISGNKADLIERLVEHDKESFASVPAPGASSETTKPSEPQKSSNTTAPVPAVAPATSKPSQGAGSEGDGQSTSATAAPASKDHANPSSTKDDVAAANGSSETPAASETEKPAVDYSIGLAQTDAEKELERRKARAAKFGIVTDSTTSTENTEDGDAAAKALAARAKRFGTGAQDNVVVRSLDQALPERGARKRDRPETGSDSRGGKRGRSERGGRGSERGGRNREGGGAGSGGAAPAVKKITDDPEEKRKAEQRAKKFGLAT